MISNKEKNCLYGYKRQTPFSNDLFSVRRELRERRKQFLGSYIPLANIVCRDSKINDELMFEFHRFCFHNFLLMRT